MANVHIELYTYTWEKYAKNLSESMKHLRLIKVFIHQPVQESLYNAA